MRAKSLGGQARAQPYDAGEGGMGGGRSRSRTAYHTVPLQLGAVCRQRVIHSLSHGDSLPLSAHFLPLHRPPCLPHAPRLRRSLPSGKLRGAMLRTVTVDTHADMHPVIRPRHHPHSLHLEPSPSSPSRTLSLPPFLPFKTAMRSSTTGNQATTSTMDTACRPGNTPLNMPSEAGPIPASIRSSSGRECSPYDC